MRVIGFAAAALIATLVTAVACNGDGSSDPEPGFFDAVVYESIDAPPVSLTDALEMIRQRDVYMIRLQPDAYSGGEERWYEYTHDGETLRWKVNGIDVLIYTDSSLSGLVIATSDTSVGVTEQELETIYDTIRRADVISYVRIVDDREWWANGQPEEYEEKIVDLDADS